jgi:hypothetical protein
MNYHRTIYRLRNLIILGLVVGTLGSCLNNKDLDNLRVNIEDKATINYERSSQRHVVTFKVSLTNMTHTAIDLTKLKITFSAQGDIPIEEKSSMIKPDSSRALLPKQTIAVSIPVQPKNAKLLDPELQYLEKSGSSLFKIIVRSEQDNFSATAQKSVRFKVDTFAKEFFTRHH